MTQSALPPNRPVIASEAGDVRVGPVASLPVVLTEMGVSPRRVFARAGVKLSLFSNPENRLPFEALGRLFEAGREFTNCQHLGLLVGERFSLSDLSMFGTLMLNAPTVGVALQELMLHMHLDDRGAVPVLLEPERSSMLLGYSIYKNNIPASAMLYDAAIAMAYRIIQQVCGTCWNPLLVQFSHSRPTDVHYYHHLFGSNVQFDAEVSGVAFTSSWLEHPIENSDAALHDAISISLRQGMIGERYNFTDEVNAVLHQAILSGGSSSRSVAALFGIHERTLRKRLTAEGTSLRRLVNQTRFELAKQLLQNTTLPVMEIAAAMNYSDPNVFSRAFRTWAGASPRKWRADHCL